MTVISTTIPAVKAALVDQLTALTIVGGALENVAVTWGIPTKSPGKDWIFIGDIHQTEEAAAIARTVQPREERYTVEVKISVTRSFQDSQRGVTTTAFAYLAEIENLIRPLTPPPLAVNNVYWITMTRIDLEEQFDDQTRESLISVELSVMARI